MKEKTSVGVTIFSLCSIPFTTAINGYTLKYLWAWFVAETFGLRQLGLAQAIGLGTTISFMTVTGMYLYLICKLDKDEDNNNTSIITGVIINILFPLMLLGEGWIIHLFV